ncbi:cobyrinate a,c-diamide synthase [Limibaculum sp. M0105]|uniref:Cobyrinate a,c-diamide synthase n=1 Tax=Thermohalobaculum xanthum TaxID=2753746 RepID=A0A8J7M3J9_9RHOB|nr:cobyrinate a,c-diamide synthase [Thermohalobaculum xanthum]MBK0397671.1 cobyrinate a,c-diamide synthase [Thermohalobaculum xanthum]
MSRGAGPRGFVIAAPASGAGKTTVTLGLVAALVARGHNVVPAKSGPDYIDPAFLAAAARRDCVTLDAFAADPAQLRARASAALAASGPGSLLVVEGAMGLFDGADDGTPAGCGSTADVAAALGLSVVVVLDVARMGQGAAAIVRGLAGYRDDVRVAGVLLNRVASARHEQMLRCSVGVVAPVLGTLGRYEDLVTPSRHLGLVQAGERADLADFIATAAKRVSDGVDLGALVDTAVAPHDGAEVRRLPPPGQRVAVARDLAFAFAYPHMLADWRAQGAEIRPFSPLADEAPDAEADAVFLPGGYPELHAAQLAAASRFREGMIDARARGARIYGECGGYMVLGKALVDADGVSHRMLGFLELETSFAARRMHLGYRRLTPRGGPWQGPMVAHEFHYATTLHAEGKPLFDACDAAGTPLEPMGLVDGRISGSFAHVIEPG